ncbi:hypothetical protein [Yoonia sp. R2-816]|uniref:hypothetical protein n=1 Tax=Yoonia sp. R2-816 TaxID=3342638 RepID=UPI00372D3D7F
MTASVGAADSDMVPLATILADQPEQSYQYVRCAAFYLANVEWAGQAISEEVFESSKKSLEDLLLIATLVRSADSADGVEHIAETVNLDTRQIADFYLENYRESYALRGTAWEANAVWEGDAATCQPIAEAASQIAKELGD